MRSFAAACYHDFLVSYLGSLRTGWLLASVWLLLAASDAQAYVDPGTGSYLIQVVLGVLLGAMFTLRSTIRAAFAYLTRFFGKRHDGDPK